MDDPAFVVPEVSTKIQEILLAASTHAVSDLERLIKENEDALHEAGYDGANVQDPDTGATPLHSAIAACEVEEPDNSERNGEAVEIPEGQRSIVAAAEKTVEWLLANGAQWNVLDHEWKTPGCRAWDLGDPGKEIYERIIREAMIRELLIGKLERMQALDGGDGYIELASEEEGEEEDAICDEEESGPEKVVKVTEPGVTDPTGSTGATANAELEKPTELEDGVVNGYDEGEVFTDSLKTADDHADSGGESITNTKYLSTPLTSTENALVDAHHNGVMMTWEKSIMHRSASALLQTAPAHLLNVGFGMGIFDTFIQQHEHRPLEHHIIEAHPDVLKRLRVEGWYEKPGVIIHEGTWREVCSELIAKEKKFDAIFYDTFAETYTAFRDFFSDAVPNLLFKRQSSRWSFFNGMGADRQICYDIYQKVVDCELDEAGWIANFEEMEVPNEVLHDEKEWENIRRKYWVVKTYRIPIVRYKGVSEALGVDASHD